MPVTSVLRKVLLFVGCVLFGVSAAVSAGDNTPKQGAIYTIVVEGGSGAKLAPWKRLQAFNSRLHDLFGVPEDADLQVVDIGCNECQLLDDAGKNGPSKPPARLTYIFYGSDREAVSSKFMEAWDAVRNDKMLWDESFTMTLDGKPVAGSACSDYPPPCYNRPVCTLYAGCSKSQYSCTKCTGM